VRNSRMEVRRRSKCDARTRNRVRQRMAMSVDRDLGLVMRLKAVDIAVWVAFGVAQLSAS